MSNNNISNLPINCISLIFPYCQFQQARNIRTVCKSFNTAGKLRSAQTIGSSWRHNINICIWRKYVELQDKGSRSREDKDDHNTIIYTKYKHLVHEQWIEYYQFAEAQFIDIEIEKKYNSNVANEVSFGDLRPIKRNLIEAIQQARFNKSTQPAEFLKQMVAIDERWYLGLFLFPNLIHLQLNTCYMSANLMYLLATFLPQLAHLNLLDYEKNILNKPHITGSYELYLSSVGKMSKLQTFGIPASLHSLFISNKSNTQGVFQYLANTDLALSLKHFRYVIDEIHDDDAKLCSDLIYLKHFKILEEITFQGKEENFPLEPYKTFLSEIPNLTSVNFEAETFDVGHQNSLIGLQGIKNLKYLRIYRQINSLELINRCGNNLQTLQLQIHELDDKERQVLLKLPNLTELKIEDWTYGAELPISSGIFRNNLPSLTKLYLEFVYLGQRDFDELMDCLGSQLVELKFGSAMPSLQSPNEPAEEAQQNRLEFLDNIKLAPNLKWICIDGGITNINDKCVLMPWITNEVIQSFFNNYPPNLTHCEIFGNHDLRESLIDIFINHPIARNTLKSLKLEFSKVQPTGRNTIKLIRFKDLITTLTSLVELRIYGNLMNLAENSIDMVKNYANELFATTSKFVVVNGRIDPFVLKYPHE